VKFRKKPVVIEAVQWDGANLDEVNQLAGIDFTTNYQLVDGALMIQTLESPNRDTALRASVGDWIIKGVKRELYPCKPDIFEATYEAAE